MNILFLKHTSFGMITAAMMLSAIAVSAQDNKKVKKQKQEEIIIKKKGDSDKKTTIIIDGDAVTINGKPITEFNDHDLSVMIDRNFSYDAPNSGARSFQRIPGVPVPPTPPMPPYYFNRGAYSIDGDGINLKAEPKAMLGVYTEKNEKGAKIAGIIDNSPAEKTGLQKGDIITKVNNTTITDASALSEIIGEMKPGDKVDITYIRDNSEKKISIQLGERKDRFSRSFSFNVPQFKDDFFRNYRFDGPVFGNRPRLGLKIQDTEDGNGVKVIDLEDSSPAATSGIKKGDIITGIDDAEIKNTDDAREKITNLQDKSTYTLKLLRNGTVMKVDVKVPKKLKTTDL